MEIRIAKGKVDLQNILLHDKWISAEILEKRIKDQQVYVLYEKDNFAGWMRWGLFWDNTPFMNMLHLLSEYQGKGYGKKIVQLWEKEMKSNGYFTILTSSSKAEAGQYFFMKLGFKNIGSFKVGDEPLEIIFSKEI